MKNNKFRKGEYERDIEYAKDLLQNNAGISEIVAKTNLNEDDIRNIIRKRDYEIDDKKTKLF